MQNAHEYLSTTPFDLYELSLFHLVVKHRSFTRAAQVAGLTQSAVTRQMQGMERSLGLDLLERTTRSVRVTPAGEDLYRASQQILGEVDATLQRLREDHGGARKHVRVGVSSSIALAYLPGFFHANLRRAPEIGCQVSSWTSEGIVAALLGNELDLGVFSAPARLSSALRVIHRFEDAFTLIVPADTAPITSRRRAGLVDWVGKRNWLVLRDESNTGRQLRGWMRRQGWKIDPVMELDDFDWIINLVSLGLGVSLVPIGALALYPQKRSLRRVTLPHRFTRHIVVAAPRGRKLPEHVKGFVENILF